MARILFIIPRFQKLGGTERAVARLANALSCEHSIHLCTLSAEDGAIAPDSPFTVHVMHAPKDRPSILRVVSYVEQARWLRSVKRTIRPTLSISNLWRADLLNILSGSGERKVSILHAGVAGAAANVKLQRFRWLAAHVYRRFDRIVGVSREIRKEAISLYGLSPSKVIHIPNAIEAAKPRTAAPLVDVIWCGRFVDEKNPLGAVEVLRALLAAKPELSLAMVGDGPLLESSVRSCGTVASKKIEPGRVAFLGAVDRAAELIASSRLLISTSRTESFGLVVGEALTHGIPVAAADAMSGGPHEVLGARTDHDPARSSAERTPAGCLLPIPVPGTETVALWVDAVATILDDPALHADLREGARKRAAEFSPTNIDCAWEILVDELS